MNMENKEIIIIAFLVILTIFNIIMYLHLHKKIFKLGKITFHSVMVIIIAFFIVCAIMVLIYFLFTTFIPMIHDNFNFAPKIIGN